MINSTYLVEESLYEQQEPLTQAFHIAALSKGWPSEVSSKITINLSLDGFEYVIPPDIQDEVDLLEYGDATQGISPKALLQTFENSIAHKLENDLAESLEKELAAAIFKEFMA
jgi:hypothetical protein